MKVFNINQYIWVRLRPEAVSKWKKDYEESASMSGLDLLFQEEYEKNTKNGWTKFQMWEFMKLFGDDFSAPDSPIQTNILIDENDLKEPWEDLPKFVS